MTATLDAYITADYARDEREARAAIIAPMIALADFINNLDKETTS